MRRIFGAALVGALLLLTACASLMGPRQVDIPLYRLQEALSHRFPFNNRYLDLFDINISNPRLALQPGTDRIVTSFDALIAPPFMKSSWNGTLSISGGLGFDPARNAVMLTDPRLENLDFNGLDPSYAREVKKIGGFLAADLLRGVPLYTFSPDQLHYGGTNFFPSRIATGPGGLVVTFEPVK